MAFSCPDALHPTVSCSACEAPPALAVSTGAGCCCLLPVRRSERPFQRLFSSPCQWRSWVAAQDLSITPSALWISALALGKRMEPNDGVWVWFSARCCCCTSNNQGWEKASLAVSQEASGSPWWLNKTWVLKKNLPLFISEVNNPSFPPLLLLFQSYRNQRVLPTRHLTLFLAIAVLQNLSLLPSPFLFDIPVWGWHEPR